MTTKIDLVRVPYSGAGPAVSAVVGNQVPVGCTALPPTTTLRPVAPRLFVTPGRADVGASGSSATFVVRNDGTGSLTWSAATTAGPLRPEPASGTLAPGASANVVVAIDRANQAEGAFNGTVAFGGNGGSANVTVVGRAERGPVVTVSTNPSPLVGLFTPATGCAPSAGAITAAVTDESEIVSVTLHWRGPGRAPGSSTPMAMRAGRFVATLGPFTSAGSLEWWVRAVDARGNVTTAPTRSAPVTATCIR